LERLSVAAVIDGVYQYETDENGNTLKKYISRTDEDIQRFEEVVRNAMGYNEARGDQVTVQSFQFSSIPGDKSKEPKLTTFDKLRQDYGKIAANIVLVLMFFLFVLRPVLKTVKEIKAAGESEEEARKGSMLDITDEEAAEREWEELPSIKKAEELAKKDMDKAANILKSWLREDK
jgi:flagellar M-ring protein FliF